MTQTYKGYAMINTPLPARFAVIEADPIRIASLMGEGLTQEQAEYIAGNTRLSRVWGTATKDHRERTVGLVERRLRDLKNMVSIERLV